MRKTIIEILENYNIEYSSKANTQKLAEKLKETRLVVWYMVSQHQKLSEDFIREFQGKVVWYMVSQHQKLSEDFIGEFQDKVEWYEVSQHQKLSEDFIREFKDKADWGCISIYQKLSEDFIREFQDKVEWSYIIQCQKLSEEFIREFQDKVDWGYISKHQKLSEDFIREFKDKVNWVYVRQYQKLSKEFIKEFRLTIPKNSWLYTTKEKKLQYIKKNTKYEVVDNDYIIAYKSVRSDNYSVYNFQYHYTVGNTYTSHCDCNLSNENSFGLSAWTKDKALEYYSEGKLLRVKIKVKDIGAIVRDCQKIRCSKLEVLEEVSF